MKKYFFRTTIRNARKNGVLTFAKLFGLTISFAVVLFAVGYVYYETSFDKNIPDHEKIYRCLMQGQLNGEPADFAVTSPAQAEPMVREIPEITEAVRILSRGNSSISYKNQTIDKGRLYYADPEFFDFFGIPLKTNMENPLASEENVVIAKSIAEKHFGSVLNALGQSIDLGNNASIISGVFEDLPANFHLRIGMIQSIEKSDPEKVGWESQNYYTYIKTNHEIKNLDELNFKISKTVFTYYMEEVDGANAKSVDDLKLSESMYILFTAEPLREIHFSNHKFDPAVTSNKIYVYGAIVLALLVLLISSINFSNLTIANISTRLKEVGIRKTIGANRKNIIAQFFYETMLFIIVSFMLATIIYFFAGNSLANLFGFEVDLNQTQLITIIASVFAGLLLYCLLLNVLPIITVSRKQVLISLKGNDQTKKRHWGNNSFLLVQFVLSTMVILSSVIATKQINYLIHKDRGYDTENVMMISMWNMHPNTRKSFIEKLSTYSAVKAVSTSDVYFGNDVSMNGAFFETEEDQNFFHTSVLPVDDQFMNTFNFKLSEGRFFEKDRQEDFEAALINEAALRYYQGEGSMVGKNILVDGRILKVIGITKNFNFRSLHHSVEPLVIRRIDNFGNVFVKVENAQISNVKKIVKDLWAEYNISSAFNFEFHDEVVADHYNKDQQAKNMLLFLSIISVIIASVGLYAVSFFSIIRKTKEIGIRKVNGAKEMEIVTMLNVDYIKWIVFAFVIACPLSFFVMNKWLENFAYKTNLSWWVFGLAGVLALLTAIITVSWQSLKAAARNPVEALRYE